MIADYGRLDPEPDFQVIEDNDFPAAHTPLQSYVDFGDTLNLEQLCKKLEEVHEHYGNCNHVRIKHGGIAHPLTDMLVLDDVNFIKNLKTSLCNAILGNDLPVSAKDPFLRQANGAEKNNRPVLVVFAPDMTTITKTKDNVAKSIMNKKHDQRVILPTGGCLECVGANKIANKPFLVLATPSIRIQNGETGALNWHVASVQHMDLSDHPEQSIARLLHIKQKNERTLHPDYRI